MQVQFHNAGLANLNHKSRASQEACRAPVPVMYAQCESFSTFPPDPVDVLVPPSASIDTPPLPAASSPTLCCKMNLAGWIATYLGKTNLSLFIPSYWLTNDNGWSWWESRLMSFSFYLLLQISSPQTSWSDNLDMTQDKDVLPSN